MFSVVTQQLKQLNKCREEVEAMKEHAEVLKGVVVAKTSEAMDMKGEKESLEKMVHEIAEELVRRRIQVCKLTCQAVTCFLLFFYAQ